MRISRPEKTLYSEEQHALVARLKRARLAAGLTQLQVAKKFRRPQSWVARLESGQRRIDVIELRVLSKLYKVPLAKLIDA